MAQYKDIVLSDGTQVRVHVPPTQRIIAMVEARYPPPPEPVPPVVKEKTVTGTEIVMPIHDDPQYLEALAQWDGRDMPAWRALTGQEIDRRNALFIFKDLVVPDDWDIEDEIGPIIRLDEPDWEPSPGEMGRKRDYIQWVLLSNAADALLVQQTLAEMIGISLPEVAANEASFRGQVAGEAA